MRNAILAILLPAALLLAWETAAATGAIDAEAVSRPSHVLAAAVRALLDGSLLLATWQTLRAAAAGLAIATVAGMALGVALGLQPYAESISRPVLEVLRAIPAVAFVPLSLLVFGFGLGLEASVVAYACIWPIMIATLQATRGMNRRLLEVAATLEMPFRRRVLHIILPAVLARAATGFRTAIGFALVVAVTVEILVNPAGLGYKLILAQQSFQPDLLYACLLWLALVGLAVNAAAQRIVPKRMEAA